jgi:hypothetical protein
MVVLFSAVCGTPLESRAKVEIWRGSGQCGLCRLRF